MRPQSATPMGRPCSGVRSAFFSVEGACVLMFIRPVVCTTVSELGLDCAILIELPGATSEVSSVSLGAHSLLLNLARPVWRSSMQAAAAIKRAS